MSEGRSFHGSPRVGGRRERRVTAFVAVLLIAFVGIAIAKPWGRAAAPAPSIAPQVDATPSATLPQATSPDVPGAAPSASVGPLPVLFRTPLPPSLAWAGLRWRRLAPDDPLSIVTSSLRWRRGFVAVGWVDRIPATPVWTSADGGNWEPLLFGTSTTFWPGLDVLGVGELRTGLVALTEAMQYCGAPCTPVHILPVLSWTSTDAQSWTPHLISPEWPLTAVRRPPLFAFGPSGLIVASDGPTARIATSTDGSNWHLLPASGFPARFALIDLRGTATGYVALGSWTTTAGRREAASLWSSDGRHWPEIPTILPTTIRNSESVATGLVAAGGGLMAVGTAIGPPDATLWWQSTNGRSWRPLPSYSPLTPTTCSEQGCGRQPNGVLVGDGQLAVAVRGGADAVAWVSADGRSWRRLLLSGDIPSLDATRATLLPGGLLLSDGTTSWFGEAQGP